MEGKVDKQQQYNEHPMYPVVADGWQPTPRLLEANRRLYKLRRAHRELQKLREKDKAARRARRGQGVAS
jgi:hypothetical protein